MLSAMTLRQASKNSSFGGATMPEASAETAMRSALTSGLNMRTLPSFMRYAFIPSKHDWP